MSKSKSNFSLPQGLVRIFGAILLFFGIMLAISGSAIFVTLLNVSSVALIVIGFFIFVDSIKKSHRKTFTAKQAVSSCLLAVLFLTLGILLSLYKSKSIKIFFIVLGSLVIVLGFYLILSTIDKKKGRKTFGYFLFLSILTVCCGICIILITFPSIVEIIYLYYAFTVAMAVCGALLLISF